MSYIHVQQLSKRFQVRKKGQAGPIREMTVQPKNIDHLIADMYREMGL